LNHWEKDNFPSPFAGASRKASAFLRHIRKERASLTLAEACQEVDTRSARAAFASYQVIVIKQSAAR